MKKYLFSLLAFVCFNCANAKNNAIDSLKAIQQKNIELTNELSKLRNEVEYTKSLVQVGNGTISNQLSSSQHNLNTLSTLLTFISIFLVIAVPAASWYITYLSNKVFRSLKDANTILDKITLLKNDVSKMEENVNSIQDTIKNNLSALYQSLKDEEIKAIFKRLEVEPLDIVHVFPVLATIRLSSEYCEQLLKIYDSIKENSDDMRKAGILILLSANSPDVVFNNASSLNALKRLSVTQGLYASELIPYLDELCKQTNDDKFEEYLPIFTLAIFGTINSKMPKKIAEITLKKLNDNLTTMQKQLLITELKKDPTGIKELKTIVDWEDLLKIT